MTDSQLTKEMIVLLLIPSSSCEQQRCIKGAFIDVMKELQSGTEGYVLGTSLTLYLWYSDVGLLQSSKVLFFSQCGFIMNLRYASYVFRV